MTFPFPTRTRPVRLEQADLSLIAATLQQYHRPLQQSASQETLAFAGADISPTKTDIMHRHPSDTFILDDEFKKVAIEANW